MELCKWPWKYFWPFGSFRIEGWKLGPLLGHNYIKNQNMKITKESLLFFIILNEKKFIKICLPFELEKNDFESQNFAILDLQFWNDQKAKNIIFMALLIKH